MNWKERKKEDRFTLMKMMGKKTIQQRHHNCSQQQQTKKKKKKKKPLHVPSSITFFLSEIVYTFENKHTCARTRVLTHYFRSYKCFLINRNWILVNFGGGNTCATGASRSAMTSPHWRPRCVTRSYRTYNICSLP